MNPTKTSPKEPARTLATRATNAEAKLEQKLTYLWHEISPWQQDNAYITSGYRSQSNSYATSWKSLLYLHNETVNIYTHLLGALAFLTTSYLLYGELQPRYQTASREDLLVFACFFAGAVACLGMSGTYHTIQNHSHEVAVWGNKLDYLGIVFLIWGSFIPVLYYAFEAEPGLMKTYWTMVRHSISFCTAASLQPLLIQHSDNHARSSNIHRLRPPPVPHPSAPPSSRPHVRAHGSLSRIPRSPLRAPLRRPASAHEHRTRLGRAAGRLVHHRRGLVCVARPGEVGPGTIRYLGE